MALESPLTAEIFPTDDDEETGEPEQTSRPTGLTAEQLREILASEREANEARMRMILGGQVQRGVPLQQEEAFPEVNVDPVGLPDPRRDIEGFLTGYGKRTNEAIQGVLKEVTSRVVQTAQTVTSRQNTIQQAFAMIREAAPDLSDDVIEFAAQKVANSYRASGVDPMQALSSNLVGVAQEVLNYADETFGGAGGAAESTVRRTGGANRTGGIRTGSGRVPRNPPRDVEDAGDMVKELQAFQAKNRIY